jgi:hypothetical protein
MKEGRKSKDAEISDNFNTEKKIVPSAKDKLAALAEKRRLAREAGLTRAQDIAHYGEEPKPVEATPLAGDDEDSRSAYKMLQDMRWVYKDLKGREKLRELVESDDRQFVFMVKELMKIEAALLAAKIRKTGEEEGKGVNQNFFVVLKGLESDKKILEMTDKDVDMKQISRALNPDGSEAV